MTPVMQTFTTATETITDVRVVCLRPDLALVDIYQTIEGQKTPKGVPIPTRHIRMTQVHEKRDGTWRIRVHRVTDLRGQNK
jgi:ketosteroid isomerase-like protein